MKIFVVIPHKFAGCGFYRQYQPHNRLAKTKDCDVLLGAGVWDKDGQFSVDADIVHYHKGYFDFEGMAECKKRGIKVVVDFDDWWQLDTEHIFYKKYQEDGTTEILKKLARQADYLTVTTERLAIEARKINPNVVVLPNAFDPHYPQCQPMRAKEEKTIFGYIGGHCHVKDVRLLHGVNNRLSIRDDYKFRLMGVDGSSVYNQYSLILSDDGKLAGSHFDWIQKQDIWNYPKLYNYMDVSLVPLVDNKFNSLKSELKLIEAGFFRKAVICSNVDPYKDLLKHGENALMVNKPGDWTKNIRTLLNEKGLIEKLGNGLYETVQQYHIDRVNELRYKFYSDVLKDKHTHSSNRHSRVQVIDE